MTAFVKDVMTTQVFAIGEDTPFAAIAAALRRHRVSAFPVLNKADQVIGVVSESDLLNKLALGGGEDRVPGMITGILRHEELEKARAIIAGDLMTAPPATASPGDTVEHAAKIMYLRGVKRLPVVDDDGRLAGIVSRADVLAVYGRPDAEIAGDIRTGVLTPGDDTDHGTVDVAVTDGVVTLVGRPRTCERGHDIAAQARHVQGVVAVRDRLDYPAPEPSASDALAAFPIG